MDFQEEVEHGDFSRTYWFRFWQFIERYGWYFVFAAVVLYLLQPYWTQFKKKQSLAQATAPSRVASLEERRRLARERQQQQLEEEMARKKAEEEALPPEERHKLEEQRKLARQHADNRFNQRLPLRSAPVVSGPLSRPASGGARPRFGGMRRPPPPSGGG